VTELKPINITERTKDKVQGEGKNHMKAKSSSFIRCVATFLNFENFGRGRDRSWKGKGEPATNNNTFKKIDVLKGNVEGNWVWGPYLVKALPHTL